MQKAEVLNTRGTSSQEPQRISFILWFVCLLMGWINPEVPLNPSVSFSPTFLGSGEEDNLHLDSETQVL